eukprot:8699906-Karenia_brevis.AAC.1
MQAAKALQVDPAATQDELDEACRRRARKIVASAEKPTGSKAIMTVVELADLCRTHRGAARHWQGRSRSIYLGPCFQDVGQ